MCVCVGGEIALKVGGVESSFYFFVDEEKI